MKKYQIIYADPPWFMGSSGVYTPPYPTLSSTNILNLPVKELTDSNCALFLWCLNTQIPLALEIMGAWGFAYKAVAFCWVKTSKKTGMPNCRVGSWTLNGMELCLLGLRGKLRRNCLNVRQVIMRPRGRHSAKPPEIRGEIVKLFGDLSRIELFARQKTEGWDVWGNEVESDIELLTNIRR